MHKIINKLARIVSVFLVLFALIQAQSLVVHTALAEGTSLGVPATEAVAASAPTPAKPSTLETLMPLILMFGVMYLLILRPQQKKMKEQQEMLSQLSEGDQVVTSSGMLGRIRGLSEKVITLEVADKVQVKVLRSAVAQKLTKDIEDLKS